MLLFTLIVAHLRRKEGGDFKLPSGSEASRKYCENLVKTLAPSVREGKLTGVSGGHSPEVERCFIVSRLMLVEN